LKIKKEYQAKTKRLRKIELGKIKRAKAAKNFTNLLLFSFDGILSFLHKSASFFNL